MSVKKIAILVLIMFASLCGTRTATAEAKQKIYLLPLSYVGDGEVLSTLAREIPKVYTNSEIILLNKRDIDCLESKNDHPRQNTYSGTLLLSKCLKKYDNVEKSAKLLAITSEQFTTDKWCGNRFVKFKNINGIGLMGGKYGIVTDYRVKYVYKSSQELSRLFLLSVTLHEIGHLFGLDHCDDTPLWKKINCFMVGKTANWKTYFAAVKMLCPSCIRKLRYSRLLS